jgi:hypothetical protein
MNKYEPCYVLHGLRVFSKVRVLVDYNQTNMASTHTHIYTLVFKM